jgi:hypothetical protein
MGVCFDGCDGRDGDQEVWRAGSFSGSALCIGDGDVLSRENIGERTSAGALDWDRRRWRYVDSLPTSLPCSSSIHKS